MWETRGLLKQSLTDAGVQPQRIFMEEKREKKKTLKKQTPQQQHIHIHKPNKTTAFPVPPNQMADGMEPAKHRLKRLFI